MGNVFKNDMTRIGWILLEDTAFSEGLILGIKGFLEPGESDIDAEEIKARAKKLDANNGQMHAEFLLEHRKELIPKEWGKYRLIFPGTIWKDQYSKQFIPALYLCADVWCLCFYQLGGKWGDNARLVCFSS